jgi:ABC-type phosphate/phosphonate transport system substrate-binding protein
LKVATFLTPSVPVEYFEGVLNYLESKLGLLTTLRYESRWEGPPAQRPDPFLTNEIDLAWVTSSAYIQLREKKVSSELLPVSSVHVHSKGDERPGLFADVIISKDLNETAKEFLDIRGCRWAYNGPQSLPGHAITLFNLKQMGENTSFFGNSLKSNSQLDSIRMVLNQKADATSVDANCLALFLDKNPSMSEELFVLTSWGLLPPYAIMVRKELPPDLKQQIVDTLLHMHEDVEGQELLKAFRVRKFTPVSSADFDPEVEIRETAKSFRFDAVYY